MPSSGGGKINRGTGKKPTPKPSSGSAPTDPSERVSGPQLTNPSTRVSGR